MATISAMTNNTYSMLHFAQRAGLSLYGNQDSSDYRSYGTRRANQNAWNSARYQNAVDTSQSDMQTLQSIRSGIQGLTQSYSDTRKVFYSDYDSAMDDLSTAAKNLSSMSYDFTNADITTDENGKTTYSKNLQDALSTVSDFVSKYNDALDFTSKNSSVSTRVAGLNQSLASTTYRADSLASVGISVDSSTGKLTVSDESKLAKSLVESGEATGKANELGLGRYFSGGNRMQTILGSDGLAGMAEKNVQRANMQRSNLFPSMQSMLGDELRVANLYTGGTLGNMSRYTSVGNLVDLMY